MTATQDLFQSRKNCRIPTQADFSGCMDGEHAWKYFGATVLGEAYKTFSSNAEFHYEDFHYLNPKAFYYYFPVIDKYWRENTDHTETDDLDFWRLQSLLSAQLSEKDLIKEMLTEITDLYHFTHSLIEKRLTDQAEIDITLKRWSHLKTQLDLLTK